MIKLLAVAFSLICLLAPKDAKADPIVVAVGSPVKVVEGTPGNLVFTITPVNALDQSPSALSLTAELLATGVPDEHDLISIGDVNNNTCGFHTGFLFGFTFGTIPAAGCTVTIPFNSDPFEFFEGSENSDHGLNLVRLTAMVSAGAPGNPVQTGSGFGIVDVMDPVPEPNSLVLCAAGFAAVVIAERLRKEGERASTSRLKPRDCAGE